MRALTGALLNNILLSNTKLARVYMLIAPVALVLYFFGISVAAGFVPMVLLLGPSSATMENSMTSFTTRWSAFENTWALHPFLMVLSRYIVYILMSALGLALWILIPFPFGDEVLVNMYGFGTFMFVVMAQLSCAVYYPIMYLLNPRQDNVGIIAIFVSFGVAIALTWLIASMFDNNLLVVAFVAVLYAVSFVLACAFNAMHRGRVS